MCIHLGQISKHYKIKLITTHLGASRFKLQWVLRPKVSLDNLQSSDFFRTKIIHEVTQKSMH